MLGIILFLNITFACYNYIFHIYDFHCGVVDTVNVGLQPQAQQQQQQQPPVLIENDGTVWITPKPNTARRVGYEDEWLMAWKERHYSPTDLRVGCWGPTNVYNVYGDELMCKIPAYIPARSVPPSAVGGNVRNRKKKMISKVIFVSWFDRRLGKALYTSLMTLLHYNPEYEFVFFDDDDVNHFFCETLRDEWAIPIISKVKSGAMHADIWRLLTMQQYGGVYVDAQTSHRGGRYCRLGRRGLGPSSWANRPK